MVSIPHDGIACSLLRIKLPKKYELDNLVLHSTVFQPESKVFLGETHSKLFKENKDMLDGEKYNELRIVEYREPPTLYAHGHELKNLAIVFELSVSGKRSPRHLLKLDTEYEMSLSKLHRIGLLKKVEGCEMECIVESDAQFADICFTSVKEYSLVCDYNRVLGIRCIKDGFWEYSEDGTIVSSDMSQLMISDIYLIFQKGVESFENRVLEYINSYFDYQAEICSKNLSKRRSYSTCKDTKIFERRISFSLNYNGNTISGPDSISLSSSLNDPSTYFVDGSMFLPFFHDDIDLLDFEVSFQYKISYQREILPKGLIFQEEMTICVGQATFCLSKQSDNALVGKLIAKKEDQSLSLPMDDMPEISCILHHPYLPFNKKSLKCPENIEKDRPCSNNEVSLQSDTLSDIQKQSINYETNERDLAKFEGWE
ncbi:hypothetical protein ROZALSC1DRAFT_29606, partial [Rozella allomycis CSF55]